MLGTVPVEADGSAYFELPALRSLFFVALDENDLAVKRMQSFLTVQAGRDDELRRLPRAAHPHGVCHADPWPRCGRPAGSSRFAGVPEVFDFPRDIQPILDRHCVECHDYRATPRGGPRDGGVVLTGDRGPMYSHSYYTLTVRRQVADGRNRSTEQLPAAHARQLRQPALEDARRQHYGVQADPARRSCCGCGSNRRPRIPAPTPRSAPA